jgi:peptidoglycan L-alanyl-D-glutamate endopeptidase CwlK
MPQTAKSRAALAAAHPELQRLFNTVETENPNLKFQVNESRRSRKDQETAFLKGNSKAHYGQSAHNWTPSIAVDVYPLPIQYKDLKPYRALAAVVEATAKRLGIKIRWLGPIMGDYPHYELSPWREYAKKAKPFGADK